MFNSNELKKKVKLWMQENPEGSERELQDYCEELIPSQEFQTHKWLVEHTLHWYRFVLERRRCKMKPEDAFFDEID